VRQKTKGEIHLMLPGFRILFAIVLLSISVLIFGLGAAAFLRSAHENIASAPLWRPIEPPVTARVDLTQPTLAMLRLEPDPLPVTPSFKTEPAPAAIAPAETAAPGAPTASVEPAANPPAESKPTAAVTPAAAETPAQAVVTTSPGADVAAATPAPVVQEPAREATAPLVAADTKEAPAAPMVVAAIGPEKSEAATAPAAEIAKAPEAVPPPVAPIEAAPAMADTSEKTSSASSDTLKPDDKVIEPVPGKVAALSEPTAHQSFADAKPLPAHEVKIPHPRIDPAVRAAHRQQLLTQQRARVRLVQAKRAAAARARAMAQARATAAAAAANPFATPAGPTGFPAN
jgi:hypothetical protein